MKQPAAKKKSSSDNALGLNVDLLEEAESVVDPNTVIATHLSQQLQSHAHELLGHEVLGNRALQGFVVLGEGAVGPARTMQHYNGRMRCITIRLDEQPGHRQPVQDQQNG